MTQNKYYSMQQQGRQAHVNIFGDLTAFRLMDSDVSAYSFKAELASMDADVIHVHINSYGGEVAEGWGIYNALRDHPARIITHADGFVASAALYPFMAGDERIASNLSAFFFHQVLMHVVGNADALRAAAETADVLTETGIAAFTNAGIDADCVRALEKAETWLSPAEALDGGFATSIVADDAPREMQSVKRDVLQTVLSARQPPDQRAPEGPALNILDPATGAEAVIPPSPSEPAKNSVMALFKHF